MGDEGIGVGALWRGEKRGGGTLLVGVIALRGLGHGGDEGDQKEHDRQEGCGEVHR